MPIEHKEKFNKKKVKIIGFITFLMGFSQASIIYVLSTYFARISGTENIGIFYMISYGIVLLALLNFHKAVKKIGKSRVFILALFGKVIVVATLALLPPNWMAIPFMMLYLIFSGLEWVGMDIILESYSQDRMSGRIRGIHLTILNAGFIAGPYISTRLLSHYDFHGVFAFVLILNSLILAISLVGLRQVSYQFKKTESVFELVRRVLHRKNVLRIYYISFVLEFFYALMVIYTPIYLSNLGFSWNEIGVIFVYMLIPFVLLQYPAGLLADKKMGEKELIIISLLITAATTFVIYFTASTAIAVWIVILFATRIGAALVDVLRDSYFYKRIGCDDVDLIDFFRTSMSVAYIVATGISVVFLIFFPLKAIFIFMALVVFSAILPAAMLQDNKCEKEVSAMP
jgi:MFS family permease